MIILIPTTHSDPWSPPTGSTAWGHSNGVTMVIVVERSASTNASSLGRLIDEFRALAADAWARWRKAIPDGPVAAAPRQPPARPRQAPRAQPWPVLLRAFAGR